MARYTVSAYSTLEPTEVFARESQILRDTKHLPESTCSACFMLLLPVTKRGQNYTEHHPTTTGKTQEYSAPNTL